MSHEISYKSFWTSVIFSLSLSFMVMTPLLINDAHAALGEGSAAPSSGPSATPSPQPEADQAAPSGSPHPRATEGGSAPQSVDDLITNNNLRAYSGSLSRWSIASQFNYLGGTIASPFSQNRPDVSGGSGVTLKSDIDGNISVKYNLDVKNSIMGGIGIRWIAPFTPGHLTNYGGDRFDFINPYIQYQYVYKWLGIQSVLQVQGTEWTQTDQTALGYARYLNVDQENMYEIAKTGLSIGMSAYWQYNWFNKSGPYTDSDGIFHPDIRALQSEYNFAFIPELEYQVSDKVNLRTLINCAMYEHYANIPNKLSVVHDTVYQSVGVGYSVTRDIFLYPNVQFLPGDFVSDQTNVGLTATINLF